MSNTSASPITKSIRLQSMLLDHLLLIAGTIILSVPLLMYGFFRILWISHEPTQFLLPPGVEYVFALGVVIYLAKDSLYGRGPAKHILKLQVVRHTTGEPAAPLRCLVRNFFCVVWPIEVIAVLIHPERRIGDMVAGTRIVPYSATEKRTPLHWPQLALVCLLGIGIALLIIMPVKQLISKVDPVSITLDESSYNPGESAVMQVIFADSLGKVMRTDIRVYDTYKNRQVTYVSVIAYLEWMYIEDEQVFEQLKSICMSLVYNVYPHGKVVMRFQFVSQNSGTRKVVNYVVDD